MPVLQPKLPPAAAIAPYLEAIDKQRWYSNYGPLVTQLELQIAAIYGAEEGAAVTTSSGTSGLIAALLAGNVPVGSACLMPSWTFAATPHAARAAGLKPWFHDVDPRTWALNPEAVEETLHRGACRAKAVLVVSPFGAPLDLEAWSAFQDRTGCYVVIDAAAGFDSIRPSALPAVVSLHATKILGAGEGGCLVSSDKELLKRARASCNFGFAGSRSAVCPAINGKMSEYHAAVALAGLEVWPQTRTAHARITDQYRRAMKRLRGVRLQPGYGDGWVGSTTNVQFSTHSAVEVSEQLRCLGIETRLWWGQGCHRQDAFADCPREDLIVTGHLGDRVLGLPHFPDMQNSQIDAVVNALRRTLAALESPRRRTA